MICVSGYDITDYASPLNMSHARNIKKIHWSHKASQLLIDQFEKLSLYLQFASEGLSLLLWGRQCHLLIAGNWNDLSLYDLMSEFSFNSL